MAPHEALGNLAVSIRKQLHLPFNIEEVCLTQVLRFRGSVPKILPAFMFAVVFALVGSASTKAQDAGEGNTTPPASTRSAGNEVGVQLNKLESLANGCRAYVVVSNNTSTEFRTLKLDLVMFRPDGIIARRFAVDLAPLRKAKRSVKLFDLDNVKCDEVGSFLVNDVMECRDVDGAEDDCLGRLNVTSLTDAKLTK